MGALGRVAFFGMLAMFNSPYKGVLGNGFILSIALASIASIAIVARHNGLPPSEIRRPIVDRSESKRPGCRVARNVTKTATAGILLPVANIPNARRIP